MTRVASWPAVLWLLPMLAVAQPAHWSKAKDSDGIRVELRPVAGSSIKAVRAHMQVSADVGSVLALLQDTARMLAWQAHCKQAKLVKSPGDHSALLYMRFAMPWPISDREAYSRVQWHINAVTHVAEAGDRGQVLHCHIQHLSHDSL